MWVSFSAVAESTRDSASIPAAATWLGVRGRARLRARARARRRGHLVRARAGARARLRARARRRGHL
eukprot:scaffold106283_cov27-Phaeocystis_antarctica.AAC.1